MLRQFTFGAFAAFALAACGIKGPLKPPPAAAPAATPAPPQANPEARPPLASEPPAAIAPNDSGKRPPP